RNTMALIDDIITKLNAIPIAGDKSITLTKAAFNIDFMAAFFTQVVGADTFKVSNAERTSGNGTAMVAGQADFMGYKDLTVNLSFAPHTGPESEAGDVIVSLDGSFAKEKAVQLPVISWIQVSNIGLTTSIAGSENI